MLLGLRPTRNRTYSQKHWPERPLFVSRCGECKDEIAASLAKQSRPEDKRFSLARGLSHHCPIVDCNWSRSEDSYSCRGVGEEDQLPRNEGLYGEGRRLLAAPTTKLASQRIFVGHTILYICCTSHGWNSISPSSETVHTASFSHSFDLTALHRKTALFVGGLLRLTLRPAFRDL